jgi:Fe-S-cluster containining protein
MLVRLQPDEMEPGDGITPAKGFVDKDAEGYCIYFNRDSGLCTNWDKRPKVCREYECNSDFMLQVVLREDFINIAELAKAASRAYIPKECYIKVPMVDEAPCENDNIG